MRYLILAVALLAGCAVTPGDMRSDAGAKRSFTVQAGYQLVLKRIEDYNSECTTVVFIPLGGDGINEVRNYSDLRKASITRGTAGMVPNIHQVLDLVEMVPGSTEVTVFAKSRLGRVVYVYEQVANGNNRGCVP